MSLLSKASRVLLALCFMPACKKAEHPAKEAKKNAPVSAERRGKVEKRLKALSANGHSETSEKPEISAKGDKPPSKKAAFGRAADALKKATDSIESLVQASSDVDEDSMSLALGDLRRANKLLEQYKADYPAGSKEREAMDGMYDTATSLGAALLAHPDDAPRDGEESRLVRVTKRHLPQLRDAHLTLHEMGTSGDVPVGR